MGRTRLTPPPDRICKRCLTLKPIVDFPLQNTTRKGMTWKSYRHTCKVCESKRGVTKQKENFAKGLCYCGRSRSAESKSFCQVCLFNRRKNAPKYLPRKRQQSLEGRLALKKEVFAHYGNACACCEETTFEFFEMDHEGGWGKAHRQINGAKFGGNALYRWIKRNNFPKGFRVLCGSCHSAISYWGYCPHTRDRLNKDAAIRDVYNSLSIVPPEEADSRSGSVIQPETVVV